MKKIEKFGEWITENWFVLVPVTLLGICIPILVLTPRHVSLSEKEFKCIESEPYGLETRCVTYTRKVR